MKVRSENMPDKKPDQKEYMRQLDLMLYKILEPEARERLNNIRLVNLERYVQVANYLVNFAQTGKIEIPLKDKALKEILTQINTSRDFNIVRK